MTTAKRVNFTNFHCCQKQDLPARRRHDGARVIARDGTYTCRNSVSRIYTKAVLQYVTNIATFCAAV